MCWINYHKIYALESVNRKETELKIRYIYIYTFRTHNKIEKHKIIGDRTGFMYLLICIQM